MKWLPLPEAFRDKLAAVNGATSLREKVDGLVALANTRLGFLETIQLDAALRKAGTGPDTGLDAMRVAILTASTADHLLPPVRVAGLRRGFRIEAYASGYGLYRQELMDPTSKLHAFKPDATVFSLVARDFLGATSLTAGAAEADAAIAQTVSELRGLWRQARVSFGGLVVQQAFLDVEPAMFRRA